MNEKIDFIAVARRYESLPPGPKAELRRAGKPEDLALIPAFYRLLPGIQTNPQWQRTVFFLPYVRHADKAPRLGQQLHQSGIDEKRLFQVLRSTSPNDLIQLRRLVQQSEPSADWAQLGPMLYFWSEKNKRRLVEDYFTPIKDKEPQS